VERKGRRRGVVPAGEEPAALRWRHFPGVLTPADLVGELEQNEKLRLSERFGAIGAGACSPP
jgi:hypothetical protein